MKIYLAGAIRDGNAADIAWREQLIGSDDLSWSIQWLNPLAQKTYDPNTREWSMSGVRPTADVIVPHDFWMVERADAIIFNLTALAEGYPNIGTLVEFGHATGIHPRPLIYTIVERDYTGHDSPGLYRLHPFLAQNSAIVFHSVTSCEQFLTSHARALTGASPSFKGAPVALETPTV